MATIRPSQYPGRWNPVSADAPQGSGKNRTAPGSNDGSYFDQVWFNDMDSLHQALFIASGISPNGTQDIGSASQIFDALINNRWSAIGNYSVGTIVTASNGKQYYCNQANGRDTTVSDPTTDLLDVWREYPYETVVNSNGTARKYFNGDLECTFSDQSSRNYTASPAVQNFPITFPVAFISEPESIVGSLKLGIIPNGDSSSSYESYSTTGFTFVFSGGSNSTFRIAYTAKGRWA